MLRRKRILIPYSYNENWIGGTYYIHNLILALKQLPIGLQPIIYILSSTHKEFENLLNETQYPYLKKFIFREKRFTIFERLLNKISRIISGNNLLHNPMGYYPIDAIFPVTQKSDYMEYIAPCIYWIPDFQSYYFPGNFSEDDHKKRKINNEAISDSFGILVLSSEDAKKDFLKFYPESKIKVKVLPFAITLPEFETIDYNQLKKKYDINQPFYFCPNQFWVHKNHMIVLKAIKELKSDGINIFVVFTGKENDYRFLNYTEELKKYVFDNKLEGNIRFLGFIDRKEQLMLMKQSKAVIQPSLFEGWSTVVEDAKALSKFVFLSSLSVHKEQLTENCSFFDPSNHFDLVNRISQFEIAEHKIIDSAYNNERMKFATNFISLINEF